MHLLTDTVENRQGLVFCKYCSTRIPLLLSGVPVLIIALRIELCLIRLHLGLLYAEEICIFLIEKFLKALFQTSPEAIYVP